MSDLTSVLGTLSILIWVVGLIAVVWTFIAIRKKFKKKIFPKLGDTVMFVPNKQPSPLLSESELKQTWGVYIDEKRAIRPIGAHHPHRVKYGHHMLVYHYDKDGCIPCRAVLVEKQLFVFK